jgi:hypothetical protein
MSLLSLRSVCDTVNQGPGPEALLPAGLHTVCFQKSSLKAASPLGGTEIWKRASYTIRVASNSATNERNARAVAKQPAGCDAMTILT